MEPLRTQEAFDDPDQARAARLVASARPPPPSSASKARVRREVFARLDAPPPRRVWRLSYAALGLLLFGGAAAASVTWAVVRWVQAPPAVGTPAGGAAAPDESRPTGALNPRTNTASPTFAPTEHAILSPPDALDVDVDALLRPSPSPRVALPPLVVPRPTRRTRPARAKVRGVARAAVPAFDLPRPAPPAHPPTLAAPAAVESAPPSDEGPERTELRLLQKAYRALRVHARPAHALTILRQHLRAHADSALREEALGLAIEACAAMGEPEAATFARVYVRDFPEGRFRGAAERALRRFAP